MILIADFSKICLSKQKRMNLDTQAKLISKLLHDLIAPASSLFNGLELLQEANIDPEILGFMKEGGEALNEKLKMFRFVYGATGDPSIKTLQDFSTKISPFLKIYQGLVRFRGDNIMINPTDTRVMGGLVVTLSHIAINPFELIIQGSSAGVQIQALGLKLALKEEVIDALSGRLGPENEGFSVHVILPWLVKAYADRGGKTLECVGNNPGDITFLYAL